MREVLRHGSKRPIAVRDRILHFFGQFSVAADERDAVNGQYGYVLMLGTVVINNL